MGKEGKTGTIHMIQRFQSFRYPLILQGMLVGALAGLVSVAYRLVVEKAGELMNFMLDLGRQDLRYVLVWFLVLIVAALFVSWCVGKESMISGSGIPQVEGELHGLFDPKWYRVLALKFVAGAVSIACGLSLGREGPSIQLGAMTAKGYARLTKRIKIEEKMLLTCGAGAGLSAAFNAPLAGVLFTLEEMHKNFSVEVLLSGMSACVAADFISCNICGLEPTFTFHNVMGIPLSAYWLIILLGVVLGVMGAFYNRCLALSQKAYAALPWKRSAKLLIPFLCAGMLGFVFPYVLGGGQNLVHPLVTGEFGLKMILLIFAMKFLFSMVSFGSGAPGGIFLPLLVLGAMIGGLWGTVAIQYLGMDPNLLQNFVFLAMAGFFTAIVRAPLTGIVLIVEMTGSFDQLLSITLICMVAYIVADLMQAAPVYDQLLERILEVRGKNQKEVEEAGDRVMMEIPVHQGAVADGKKVKEITWPQNCLIIAVYRGGKELLPKGNTHLHGGDVLLVLSGEDAAYSVREEIVNVCQKI